MTGLQSSSWKIRKFILGTFGSSHLNAEADGRLVRRIDPARRSPLTAVEEQISATLKETGPVSVAALVKRVATKIYMDELRTGAAVLDIGLFGDRLFHQDVIRALHAGDGILWEIDRERTSP